MAVPGFRPAPYVNLDDFERRLRTRSLQQANLDEPLPRTAPIFRLRVSHASPRTPKASNGDHGRRTDDHQVFASTTLGVVEAGLVPRDDRKPLPRPETDRCGMALVGIAIVGSVFADKGGAPGVLTGPPVVPSADDTARAPSTPADVSTIPPTGLSGATPTAPKVDTQAVATLASPAPAQTTDPRPVQRRPCGRTGP